MPRFSNQSSRTSSRAGLLVLPRLELTLQVQSCPTGASRYESNPTTLPPRIPVSPQLPPHLTRTVSLHLIFTYPPTYPDVLPDMEFESIDEDSGELDDAESELVLGRLRTIVSCRERSMAKEQGEESLGMALTFTLASAAGDVLKDVIKGRLKRENDDYERRAREYEEVGRRHLQSIGLTRVGRGKPDTRDAPNPPSFRYMAEGIRERVEGEEG